MSTNQIRFDDGAGYERFMGRWSRVVGGMFLDWVGVGEGLRWLDVGCGNGAFTEMIVERCGPAGVEGVDPSGEQVAYARRRLPSGVARFCRGDAMGLPFGEGVFDVAVMPLVIFFVPEPARGVAEMVRVVCEGGVVGAYAWDMLGGGFPYDALWGEMRGMGVTVPLPPSPEASRMEVLRELWEGAGLAEVETREMVVERTFVDFDDYWGSVLGGPSVRAGMGGMTSGELAMLKGRMRERLVVDGAGRITYSARANAVKGRVRR